MELSFLEMANCEFCSVIDNSTVLTSDNFTDKRLREYLKIGDIDDFD